MFCAIYKSLRHDQMYLYLPCKDDFSGVPEELICRFGRPQWVMSLNLAQRQHLAGADVELVKRALQEQHYYLQMPSYPETQITNW